jgi:energy-coupling factor transporter ATP-binding protein EcfA2
MRVTSVQLTNFRSIAEMDPIELGSINVLIGPNNAGKSTVIRALAALQAGSEPFGPDIRIGASQALVTLELEQMSSVLPWRQDVKGETAKCTVTLETGTRTLTMEQHQPQGRATFNVNALPNVEPEHFVVPYFSRRKTASYQEDVRRQNALQVGRDFSFLAAKLARLGNPSFPAHDAYSKTCQAILGFVITAVPSENGQRPGVYVSETDTIPIDQMGEGVPNIVGLLAELALSKNKLFLIEEPENDLHPRALKALLELILESSTENQFVISTHSNIVACYLGGKGDSKLYYIDADRGVLPPAATVRLVPPTPADRLAVLRELGYSLSDFELWDGWLILEEASAERIIRDYLVPYFAPRLARVRTLSTQGNTKVEPTFDDFYRLVRFTHLEEAYRNRAWVLVDGDSQGREIVERLRERYSTWEPDRFGCFDQAQFERYYPAEFSNRVDQVLSEMNKPARREAKRILLDDVREWLDEDEDRARAALASSAASVVTVLKGIEERL